MSARPASSRQNSWEYEEDRTSPEIGSARHDFNNIKVNIDRDFTEPIYNECHRARSNSRTLREGFSSLVLAFPALLRERAGPDSRERTEEGAHIAFDTVRDRIGLLRENIEDDDIYWIVDECYKMLRSKRYLKLATVARILEYWSNAYEAEMNVRSIYAKDEQRILKLGEEVKGCVEKFRDAVGRQDSRGAGHQRDQLKKVYARITELRQRRPGLIRRENRRIIDSANVTIKRSVGDMSKLRAKVERKKKDMGRSGRNNTDGEDYEDARRSRRRTWGGRFHLGVGGKRSVAPPNRNRGYLRRGTLRQDGV